MLICLLFSFNPVYWNAKVYDLDTEGRLRVIGVSFVTSLVLVVLFDRVKKRVQSGVGRGVDEVKDRFNKLRDST